MKSVILGWVIQSRGKYAHIDRVISSSVSKSTGVRDQALPVIAHQAGVETEGRHVPACVAIRTEDFLSSV